MNQASSSGCPRCQRATDRIVNAQHATGPRVICCPTCAGEVTAGGPLRLDIERSWVGADLDQVRVEAERFVERALAHDCTGLALAADLLDFATSLPDADYRWTALAGFVAPLREADRQ